jgi:hypothetical protein
LLRDLDGLEGFVAADQTLPCAASHAGRSCERNAAKLWVAWWRRVPWAYAAAQAFAHVAVRRRPLLELLTRERCADAARTLVFLFGSTGVPGYVWCVAKRWSPGGRGMRFPGLLAASGVGAAATLLLPLAKSVRLVTGFYVGAAVALAWSQMRLRASFSAA